MQCPSCDASLAHDARWSRLYSAVYVIFFSFILLSLLLPLAKLSIAAYILLSAGLLFGLWGLGRMLLVPLVVQANPFLEKTLLYFKEFGLHDFQVKSDIFDPLAPENSEVIIHMGNLRLRFLREGAQEYVEFGDSDALFGDYYSYDDLFVAHGWRDKADIANRDRAIGLYEACRGIRKHQKELEIIFDPANIEVALTKVRLTRDQRLEQKGWISSMAGNNS